MYQHTDISINDSNKLIKKATYFSVLAAFIILIIKLISWYQTESITIFAACLDSLLDIAASLLNLFAVRYALQPPDNNHRFGYEKASDLAVLSQSSFFCLSGIVVIVMAIKRIFHPQILHEGTLGISMMLLATLITFMLVIYQKYVIYKTKSNVVSADNLHYLSDLTTNLIAITSLLASTTYNINFLDPLLGILVAFFIFYSSWKLLKKSFHNLMDREFNIEDKQAIKKILKNHDKILGFHDLKTRYAGNKPFIQVHLEMDGYLTLYESHEIVQNIEAQILKIMPTADVIIHQDPCGIEENILYKD